MNEQEKAANQIKCQMPVELNFFLRFVACSLSSSSTYPYERLSLL